MTSKSKGDIFSQGEWDVLIDELALSLRQSQIVQKLFKGHSDKQIARELEIAVPTVRTHLTRLFSRFNLADRNELILQVFCRFREGCPRSGNEDVCPYWLSNIKKLNAD